MKMNSSEWPYIVIGCIMALLQGAVQPAFALIFGNMLGVRYSRVILWFYCPQKWRHNLVFSIIAKFCFSCETRETLHLARWNVAQTYALTGSGCLLNIKVMGQKSRSHGLFCDFCVHNNAATRRLDSQSCAVCCQWCIEII